MVSVLFENSYGGDGEVFSNIEAALAYAKQRYFTPTCAFGKKWYSNSTRYNELISSYHAKYPEVKTIDDVANIDFEMFKKNRNIEFYVDDNIIGTLRIDDDGYEEELDEFDNTSDDIVDDDIVSQQPIIGICF